MIEKLPESVGNETEKILNEHEHKLYQQTYKQAWNAAIEAAAKIIDDCNREGPYNAIGGARRIRELKK